MGMRMGMSGRLPKPLDKQITRNASGAKRESCRCFSQKFQYGSHERLKREDLGRKLFDLQRFFLG